MRLTNKIRNGILEKIEKEKWHPKIKALRERLDLIASIAMFARYDEKTRKWMKRAPVKGAFVQVHSMEVRIKGADRNWRHDALEPWEKEAGCRRQYRRRYVPNLNAAYSLLAKDMSDRHVVVDAADMIEFEKEADKALEAWVRFENFAKQALWSCSTMKQLKERYPSLAVHAPETERGVANMLAVTDEKIAKAFKAL